MFSWFSRLISKNCAICRKPAAAPRKYFNDQGKKIVVC